MLLVSILLFFILHIQSVIGYLTGSTARKAVENMQNEPGQELTSGSVRRRAASARQEKVDTTAEIQRYANTSGNPVKDTTDLGFGIESHTEKADVSIVSDDTRNTERPILLDTTDLSGHKDAVNTFKIEYEITYIHTEEIVI